MQYFQPESPYFVGDCMPFFHDGIFHLYYLLDEGHHAGRQGRGGHQWAHASTTDLIRWAHHPLALAIEHDWEGSICTGSVFWHGGMYYAFFAVRTMDGQEILAYATSSDGIAFDKREPYPLMPAPAGYDPDNFRDPFVFERDGKFHMIITAKSQEATAACLMHLTSDNLTDWKDPTPFLIPGVSSEPAHIPECADYFEWNGWYYLLFGFGTTCYRMSKHPMGPWLRSAVDILDGPKTSVMKTAPFGDNRRIGAAWIGEQVSDGFWHFGGCAVFRELVQNPDGTLGVTFPPEMAPRTDPSLKLQWLSLTSGAASSEGALRLSSTGTESAAEIGDMPRDFRLRCRIGASGSGVRYGLGIRCAGPQEEALQLSFEPGLRRVTLGTLVIEAVKELAQPFDIDLIVSGTVVDLCIGGKRCIISRILAQDGDSLSFWCADGDVTFQEVQVCSLSV